MTKAPRAILAAISLLLATGAAPAASGPLFPKASSASAGGAGVLAYEGFVSKRTSSRGTETQLATCTASVIDLPGRGPKLVTAGHCEGTQPVFFDERGKMKPTVRRDLAGGPDVAVFDLVGKSPWKPFAVRDSATLRQGETLCAFRTTRALFGVSRERVCGAFVGRTTRLDFSGRPRLVVNHPYVKGTSGSPLFDSAGRVVGVVVATTSNEGFAEPIEQATRVALAAPRSTGANPTPAQPADDGGLFGELFPRAGSICLFDTCFRWEI
ncbi:MAG: trypsin-like peptidase domain-containing protein [Polyangiaceae bacterium]|nr:trypsin-like peptidase domain-containing protein [Polyangiaceae bacterium]